MQSNQTFTFQPDFSKWPEYCNILSKQGHNILVALQSIKQQIDLENIIAPQLIYRGGQPEGFTYNGTPINLEDVPTRTPMPRIAILSSSEFIANAKQIYKKFPEVSGVNMGKVLRVLTLRLSKTRQAVKLQFQICSHIMRYLHRHLSISACQSSLSRHPDILQNSMYETASH